MLAVPEPDMCALGRRIGAVESRAAGSVVFREGDTAEAMYIVLSGQVEITRQGRMIEIVGAGKALGIVSLLDAQARTVTATMRVAGELARIERARFDEMTREVPGFAWYLMEELAHRLRRTNAAL